MENKNKNLTLDGISGLHLLQILIAIAMIGVSIYLTNHYLQIVFPTGLASSAVCNISGFWNCDTTTFSPASNIFGVPISVFGIVVGFLILIGSLFPRKEFEQANKLISLLNVIGCSALFIYSITILNSLCPVCTGYYVLSFISFYLFYRYGIEGFNFDVNITGLFLSIFLVAGVITKLGIKSNEEDHANIAKDLAKQFAAIPAKKFELESKHFLNVAKDKPGAAPVTLAIFSDFQCPACKILSEQIPKMIKKYKDQVDIQYFFYPLDQNCHPEMERQVHPLACYAARIATCSGDSFGPVHDEIFERQAKLSTQWLSKYSDDLGLSLCTQKEETKEYVVNNIREGIRLGVKSTPTIFINGKKIDGLLPIKQLFILLDEALK